MKVAFAILGLCMLSACVATGTPTSLFTGSEQIAVRTEYWPDPTQPRTTPRESPPVPVNRGVSPATAATVGVVATGLINLLDRIPDGDHIEFSDRVSKSISDIDIAAAIEGEVRRISPLNDRASPGLPAQGGSPGASGGLAAGTPLAPRRIQATVQLRHGLWKFQNPIYTPKVTANLLYFDQSGQLALQQVVTFYGAEPVSSTAGYAPVVDWWSQNQRYRELLGHATRAIARQVVWLVRDDPTQKDPALRDKVLRTSRDTNWLDTVSAPCAFNSGASSVQYRAQRRAKEISIAALCPDSPFLQVDQSMQGLVWVLKP